MSTHISTTIKRILNISLSLVLAMTMLIGLMPAMTQKGYAATGTYSDLIPLGSDDDAALAAKQVEFNGMKWYIIADDSTSDIEGTVTLFPVKPIGLSEWAGGSSAGSYQSSTVRGYLRNLTSGTGSFGAVAEAIAPTELTDVNINGEKLYLLSNEEASKLPIKVKVCERVSEDVPNRWWLRDKFKEGFAVFVWGNEYNSGNTATEWMNQKCGVRPALRLDLSKVSYLSESKKFVLASKMVNVTSVEFNNSTGPIEVNGSGELSVTVYPFDATDKTVVWSSSDTSVATVANNGDVTGISNGTAVITATATNGTPVTTDDKTASCTVNVRKAKGSISYGNKYVVIAYGDKPWINPLTIIGDGRVTYISDDPNVATVDSEGRVQAVNQGRTVIVATVEDSQHYTYEVNYATYTLEVTGGGSVPATSEGWEGTYDGEYHGITVNVPDGIKGYKIMYGTEEDVYDLEECPKIRDVKDSPRTVYYQVTAEGFEPDIGEQKIEISKADSVVTTAPKRKDLSYTGEPQELVTAGVAGGGELQYSLDGTNYSTEIPKGTEEGIYTIYYKIVGDDNHNDFGPESVTARIFACIHTLKKESAVNPTCDTDGHTTYWKCTNCKRLFMDKNGTAEIDEEDTVLEATGHDYSFTGMTWTKAADGTGYTAKANFVCRNDSSHTKEKEANVTSETVDSTCQKAGIITYTATAIFEDDTYTDTKTEGIDIKAHNWGTPSYTWSKDGSICVAKRSCKNEGCDVEEQKIGDVTSEVKTPATCEEKGTTEFTASFNSTAFEEQKKDIKDIDALGHKYGAWTKLDDQHQRVCERNESHVEKAAHSWDAGIVTKEATTTAEGEKTFTCTVCKATKKESIPKKAHEHALVRTDARAATCEKDGNIAYWTCSECGKSFLYKDGSSEINIADTIIQKLGHDYSFTGMTWTKAADGTGYTAKANFVCRNDSSHKTEVTADITGVRTDSSCQEAGIDTYTAEAFFEDETYTDTKTEGIDIKAHNWGTPSYIWSKDGSICVAKRSCENEGCDAEEQKIGDVTSVVKTPATCEEKGTTEYTASFNNPAFEEQKKAVEDIDALGHKYGAWTKLDDDQHQRVCEHDGSHVETADHSWDAGIVTKEATTKEEGVRTYTCTECKAAKTAIIPKLDPGSEPAANPAQSSESATAPSEVIDTSLPKVTNYKPVGGKAKIKASWKKMSKKNSKKVDGIEVQISPVKSFADGQAWTSGAKKTAKTKTFKKLARKTTYYTRVRTYKYVDGVKHVSNWSKVKKSKTR